MIASIRFLARRSRPTGRRGGKRPVNQQGNLVYPKIKPQKNSSINLEYENDDYRSSSPSNVTMRQQLKDMFKHRPSRYNFLDLSRRRKLEWTIWLKRFVCCLDNNLGGDERINHLKDRMRECQKAFFNLKSALVKVEKQRKGFLRKQKPILSTTSPSKLTSNH